MSGWLYLIRNRDLYKIGITKNFGNRMRQLKPDNVVIKLYTNDFVKLERELHHRYKEFRIPQTEYFRLEKIHIKQIKARISHLDYPPSTSFWIFVNASLLLLFLFFLIFIFISLTINDLNIVLKESFLWTERISYCFSLLSLLLRSGKNFNFYNELKYRMTKAVFFIILAFLIGLYTSF